MTEFEIYEHLKEHDIYAEVDSTQVNGMNIICVLIEWGDWKHEHGFCDDLMDEIAYRKVGEKVTKEDGSDCYSSIHYYIHY